MNNSGDVDLIDLLLGLGIFVSFAVFAICMWLLRRERNKRKPIKTNQGNNHTMEIRIDDLQGSEIIELLREHLRCMHAVTPLESVHALDLEGLRKPEITFWSIWDGVNLAGCGALKQLDPRHGEIKSMRTAYSHLRQGVASRMLTHILSEAKRRGYARVSLETGAFPYFEPARKLYATFGFNTCEPFADYKLDPNSVFMTKEL